MANAQALDGAPPEDGGIHPNAEEVLFGMVLDKAGWTEWGGGVPFPFEA